MPSSPARPPSTSVACGVSPVAPRPRLTEPWSVLHRKQKELEELERERKREEKLRKREQKQRDREFRRNQKKLEKLQAEEQKKLQEKIKLEERKLLLAQRNLQSIRLIAELLSRAKVPAAGGRVGGRAAGRGRACSGCRPCLPLKRGPAPGPPPLGWWQPPPKALSVPAEGDARAVLVCRIPASPRIGRVVLSPLQAGRTRNQRTLSWGSPTFAPERGNSTACGGPPAPGAVPQLGTAGQPVLP